MSALACAATSAASILAPALFAAGGVGLFCLGFGYVLGAMDRRDRRDAQEARSLADDLALGADSSPAPFSPTLTLTLDQHRSRP